MCGVYGEVSGDTYAASNVLDVVEKYSTVRGVSLAIIVVDID